MLKKRLSVILASIFILLAFNNIFAAVHAIDPVLGDLNSDGEVDIKDYIILKRAVVGKYTLNETEESVSDINEDGSINVFDYIMLKRIVLGTIDNEVTITRKESVSRGKTYTTSVTASDTYPDTYSSELTDGAIATSASYTNGAFCGYTSNVDVTIDLGSVVNNLIAFELSYLSVDEAGILPPSSFSVYGSNSSFSSGTLLGTVSLPKYSISEVASKTILLSTPVNYRYIKFSVKNAAHWVFIDECTVYANVTVSESELAPTPESIYASDKLTDEILRSNIESVSSGIAYNAKLGESVVSTGNYASASVSASVKDSRCANNASYLIDGAATGSAYDSGRWYGIGASSESSVTVNLGQTYSNINGFSLHCFNRSASSIHLPPCVDVSVSSNGYTYTKIGRLYSVKTDRENYAFSLVLDTLVKARYVKFTLSAGEGYYWIEEAQVYQNAAASDKTLYGTFDMPLASNSTKWRSSESDYNEYQNLASGLRPEILSDTSLSLSGYYSSNSLETEAVRLTDGALSSDTSTDSDAWFRFNKGSGRSVFFDLGHISAVSKVSFRALKLSSAYIELPSAVNVVLSDNGVDWYLANTTAPSGSNASICETQIQLSSAYSARYVVLCFPVVNNVYIDEISVFGTKNSKSSVQLASSNLFEYSFDFGSSYIKPSDDLLGGASDILLVYHNIGNVTKDMLLPYVAYIDENGNIADTMYNGFLFLPSPGSLPSGGTPYGTNTVSDWNYLYNKLFAADRDFDALDQAVAYAKKLLGDPDYKVQVYVTIPHLDSSLYGTAFGDIDGDGDYEDLRYLDNRVYVSKYYAQKVINTFNSKKYQNIEIGGFYWFHETITPNSNDATTAQKLNLEFDALDIDLFWIPYYRATGYSSWSTFGFDAAFYQPNYAFGANIDESRLQAATNEAQNYGMTMEMEIDSSAVSDLRFFRKYMDYLAGGVKYGYIRDAVIAYYQSFDDIGMAADAKNERIRLIYDYTYDFIKGSLDITPDTVEDLSFSIASDSIYNGTLNSSKRNDREYAVAVSPDHGSVSVAADGTFRYYPNKGFKGTDTFTYRIGNYLGWSEECVVTITVG